MGKLPKEMLEKYVFPRVGSRRPEVLIGPSYGEDAAIISINDEKVLVVHSDPITAAYEHLGWLAVNIACNDIAVRGAEPRWILPVILLPENRQDLLDEIMNEVDSAAKALGVMVVGGHTEYTSMLKRPVISMTAMGITYKKRYITTGGGKPGDSILITKTAGIEATAILARDFKELLFKKGASMSLIKKAQGFISKVSVVREALILADLGVHVMHDPTSGGILGGLYEIACASNVELRVMEEKIPIADETQIFCDLLGLNPLKILSSGSLLALVPKDKVEEAMKQLRKAHINSAVIGYVCNGCSCILTKRDGAIERIDEPIEDDLVNLWRKI
jgi:hydrogenase maturation factor